MGGYASEYTSGPLGILDIHVSTRAYYLRPVTFTLKPHPSCSLHAPFPTVSRPCVISGRLHPLMVCFDPISRIFSCCSSTFTSLRSSNPMLPEPPSPPSPCVYLSITAIRWRSDMCWRQSKTPFFGAIHHALLLFASRISAPERSSSGIESVALCWI